MSLIFQMIKEYKNWDNESDVHINRYLILYGQPYQKVSSYSASEQETNNCPCKKGKWSWRQLSHPQALSLQSVMAPHRQDTSCSEIKTPSNNCGWTFQGSQRKSPCFAQRELSWGCGQSRVLAVYTVRTSSGEGFSISNPRGTLLHFSGWPHCEEEKRCLSCKHPCLGGASEQGGMGCLPHCTVLPVEVRSVSPSS